MYRLPRFKGSASAEGWLVFAMPASISAARKERAATAQVHSGLTHSSAFNNTQGADHENRLRHSVCCGFRQVTRLLHQDARHGDRLHRQGILGPIQKSGKDVSLAIQKCAPDYVEQGSRMVGRFVGVTLMVDDIEEQYNRLVAKGVEFTGRPEKQSWGGTLANLKDLEGNVLTLMQEAR